MLTPMQKKRIKLIKEIMIDNPKKISYVLPIQIIQELIGIIEILDIENTELMTSNTELTSLYNDLEYL
jgi:hypothetical protein